MFHRWRIEIPLCLACGLLLASSGAAASEKADAPSPAGRRADRRAVLLVHGINNDGSDFARMGAAMQARGFVVRAIHLQPNDGAADIPELARQVDAFARAMGAGPGSNRIDVVGFSMGALVSRWWIRRGGGAALVRRFVSISGPHHGTALAWFRFNPGARSMRFGSPLLRDLARDEGDWGDVEVSAFWTPYDWMILPRRSSRLKGAWLCTFDVSCHDEMVDDPRVVSAVIDELLRAEGAARPRRSNCSLPPPPPAESAAARAEAEGPATP